MKSKKKHTNQDFEVVDGIGKYMDDGLCNCFASDRCGI